MKIEPAVAVVVTDGNAVAEVVVWGLHCSASANRLLGEPSLPVVYEHIEARVGDCGDVEVLVPIVVRVEPDRPV